MTMSSTRGGRLSGAQAAGTLLALAFFSTLLAGLALVYSDMPAAAALRYGLMAGGAMLGLALGLWQFSRRVPWPTPFRFRFLVSVGIVGFAFGTVFHGFDRILTALREDTEVLAFVFSGPNPIWDILLWAFLGTTMLMLFYGIRGNDAAHFHRLAAAEAHAAAAQAQVDMLRGQLNPHLVHNALHSIMVLTSRDPVRAQEAISDLGDMLRYTLDSGREWDVSLSEEWEFTQSYLAIESIRLQDRLVVTPDLDPAALEVTVPRFTLQPLVENAIRHGVSKLSKGGEVRITAAVVDDHLHMTVINPRPTPSTGGAPSDGHGVGLSNLRTRLRLRHGEAASLVLDEGVHEVVAHVVLPPVLEA